MRYCSVLFLVAALGCGGGSTVEPAASTEPSAAPATSSLTIYSGRKESLVSELIDTFSETSGVTVQVNYAGTSELAATLMEEGEATPAHVFFSQDAGTIGYLAQQGMLAPLPEEILGAVPAAVRDGNGRWVGVTARARVLAWSTERVAESDLPADVDALTDPAWRGRVGWAPTNASFKGFLAAMVERRGEDATRAWLQAMLANEPRAYPSNTPMVTAIGEGEIDVGLTNHYYLHRLKAERGDDFPVANHFFANGEAESMINLASAGILQGAADAPEARAFVSFLLSEPGQAFFAERNYEFPLVPGTAPPVGLPAVADLSAPTLGNDDLAELETTERLLREVGAIP